MIANIGSSITGRPGLVDPAAGGSIVQDPPGVRATTGRQEAHDVE
jgi:hypothetical protein